MSMDAQTRLFGLAPICDAHSRVLVLGSMPSAASLAAGQYYAFAHNQFWPIMQDLAGEARTTDYARRTALLLARGIALWDSVASCVRPGSLDSAIRQAQVNDFDALWRACPAITDVFFNGKTAAALFQKHVALPARVRAAVTLPSTSPANTMRYAQKLAAWQAINRALRDEGGRR